MTEAVAAPAGADEQEWVTEEWTFGGTAGTGKAARHIWYDQDRHMLRYPPDKGTGYVVGGVYATQVRRAPRDDGDGVSTWRKQEPRFAGRQPDREFAAVVEAGAYAARRAIAAAQAEARARRGPGALDDLIAPIEAAAAKMTGPQRDALIALVTRRVYLARREPKR